MTLSFPGAQKRSATEQNKTHDEQNGNELKSNTPPHQFLAQIRVPLAEQGVKAHAQNHKNCQDGECCQVVES